MATEPLKSILADINSQKIVLPQFQRDFVWSPSFVIKLLTSLFNGYPIGSLLLMENNESYDYRPIDGVTGDRRQSEGETILVLDGQQRLTACWRAFFGTLEKERKYCGRYYFNYKSFVDANIHKDELDSTTLEDMFIFVKPPKVCNSLRNTADEMSKGLFPLDILFGQPRGSNYADWLQKYNFFMAEGEKAKFELLSGISSRFQTDYVEKVTGYQVNYEKITRDTSADVICTVFETINTTEVKLTVFDLLVAKCFKQDIRLRDNLDDAVARYSNIAFFDPSGTSIAAIQLPRIIGLLHNGQCKKGDILKLPVDAIRRNWETAVSALDKMLGIMRTEFGCAKFEFVPSMDIISPLSVILSDIQFNRSQHFAAFKRLYWNLVFSLFLSGAPESKSAKIVREWREMAQDLNREISAEAIRTFSLTPEDMRDATKASALYKGVISLLIAEGVRDFGTGHRPVNSPNAEIEDHHIFPQQFLRNSDIKGYMANGILNRTPIYGSINRAIGSTAPEVYFNDKIIVGDEPLSEKEILDGHAISLDLVTRPFSRDVFEAFCNDRQRRILAKIERVTGQKILAQESEVNH